jgi:glycosyltransferase involved in cell wall biosynthesis
MIPAGVSGCGVAGLDNLLAEMAAIRASGLFLPAWYLSRRPDLAAQGDDGLAHFCRTGWREGANPNPYFDTTAYLAANPDVARAGFNPLWHYIEFGEFEGRDPGPWFFVTWYRAEYGLGPRDLCLAHYLARRLTGQVNPVPVFDAAWYLDSNPDIAAAHEDPFEHFMGFGPREGRDPAPDFDIKFYMARYAEEIGGQNPLLHYLANRASGNFVTQRPAQESLIPGAVRHATRPSEFFEEFQPVAPGTPAKAKLLAFYLPQFHHVKENDAWWGKGFTDWTNLGRALPRFTGHLQPRIPRDLGFYSLDDPATLRRQIAMAKGAGLGGFVFYYYWFNAHRLLEKPLEQLLADATLDFPFCVMWANENWTRRWDGLEREVLIAQEYRERDDPGLIASFARLFADPRYIRVAGRPLLMIYRVTLIPNAAARIAAWRGIFNRDHNENPLIIMAQSLGDFDPAPYGLDGAVEFPPHKISQTVAKINEDLDLLDPDFAAAVHDYEAIAAASLALPPPDHPLIKTIVPGWDNDPRREGQGLVLHGATPAKYQAWLEDLVNHTARHDFYGESIICVNAWNEWAEGAFLEPDIHFGGAYLNATSRALCDRDVSDLPAGILLVGHDAHPHGSQMLLLHIARQLRRQWGIAVHILLLGVGPLLGQYYETASVSIAYDRTIIGNLLDKYKRAGIRNAIVNSAAAARVVPWLTERGIATTLLVHELPLLLREYNLEVQARLGATAATQVIFSSEFLREKFQAHLDLDHCNAIVLPQGNYKRIAFDAAARKRVRRELGIADADFMVLGVGFADLRKGFDLFLQMARKLGPKNFHFVWVGDIQPTLATYLDAEIILARATGKFHHIGFTDEVAAYYAAADLYALTSREDPYPTVVLEALACGVPSIAFDETGGIPELLRKHGAGAVAPRGDTDAFMSAIQKLADHKRLNAGRDNLIAVAQQKFDFPSYGETLLRITAPALKTISVCIPNFNYAPHLDSRLQSIFSQTYPVREILFLDDASTDDSIAVAQAAARAAQREITVLANPRNQGVFAQWRRAAEAARGEYIWIAEADDESDPAFLQRLVTAMAAADTPILAFTDSKAIDENGATTMRSYRSYYFTSGAADLAASAVWPAREFAAKFLYERNLILNVSAVLWRRDALLGALQRCGGELPDWRVAGDWRLYLELLAAESGSVVYVAEPLNAHRRHAGSVTQKLDAQRHIDEIHKIHRIATDRLGLGKAEKTRQANYIKEILGHFGLASKSKPKPRKPRAAAAIVARKRKV